MARKKIVVLVVTERVVKMSEDREYITDENLYSTGQKVPSKEFRNNWDNIRWDKEESADTDRPLTDADMA